MPRPFANILIQTLLLTLLLPRHRRLLMSIPSHRFLVRVYMLAALVLAGISCLASMLVHIFRWHRLILSQVLPMLAHLIVTVLRRGPHQQPLVSPVLVTVLSLALLSLSMAMLVATVLRRGPHEQPLASRSRLDCSD